MRRIETEVRISMGPRRIVSAFFDEADLKAWWKAAAAQSDARAGAAFRLDWAGGAWRLAGAPLCGRFTGVVGEHDGVSGFTLESCRWEPSDGSPAGPTRLRIATDSKINKTRVRVEQEGFGAGGGWDLHLRQFTEGWERWLESLRLYLEAGAAQADSTPPPGITIRSDGNRSGRGRGPRSRG